MRGLSLFQWLALLPIIVMLQQQNWPGVAASLVIYGLLILPKKTIEKEVFVEEVNHPDLQQQTALVSMLKQEVPPHIDALKQDLIKTQQINSESFSTLNSAFYQLLEMTGNQSDSLQKVLSSISQQKAGELGSQATLDADNLDLKQDLLLL